METKVCKGCGQELPLNRDYFGQYKNERNGEVRIGFRSKCRECIASNSRKHYEANREQARERQNRRQRREQTQNSAYDPNIARWLNQQLGGRCRYCGDDLKGQGEIDHITPVARGGSGRKGNLTLACRSCNRSKLAKTLDEFLQWRIERKLTIRSDSPSYEDPDPHTSTGQRQSS